MSLNTSLGEAFIREKIKEVEKPEPTWNTLSEMSNEKQPISDIVRNPESFLNLLRQEQMVSGDSFSEIPETLFKEMPSELTVSVDNLQSDSIGELRRVEAFKVVDIDKPRPKLVSAEFKCTQCGHLYEKEQHGEQLKSPYKCKCGSRKFEVQTKNFQNSQKIKVAGDWNEVSVEFVQEFLPGNPLDLQKEISGDDKFVYIPAIIDTETDEDGKRSYKLNALGIEAIED